MLNYQRVCWETHGGELGVEHGLKMASAVMLFSRTSDSSCFISKGDNSFSSSRKLTIHLGLSENVGLIFPMK